MYIRCCNVECCVFHTHTYEVNGRTYWYEHAHPHDGPHEHNQHHRLDEDQALNGEVSCDKLAAYNELVRALWLDEPIAVG